MEKSLKISTKTLRRGLAPAISSCWPSPSPYRRGMWANSAALDDYFGRGARTITVVEGSGGWDRTYYPRLYANARSPGPPRPHSPGPSATRALSC